MLEFRRNSIDLWDEAIPLGNGFMGGLLFGDNSKIKLNLDCCSLWDLRQDKRISDSGFKFAEFLSLVHGGEAKRIELEERFGTFFINNPYPTKILAGKFEFRPKEPTKVEFSFDMKEPVGVVKFSNGERLETFFNATNFLGYIRCPKSVDFEFVPPKYQSLSENDEETTGNLHLLDYPQGTIQHKGNTIVYCQPTCESEYYVIIKNKSMGEYNELVFGIKSQEDDRSFDELDELLSVALNEGFDSALKAHKEWWTAYFSKNKIVLPEDNVDIVELYDFMNYIIGAGSRKGFAPMPLQGVWTEAEGNLPPWKGDYHFDLNVQGTYNWAYRAGRFDEIYPLIDYFLKNNQNLEEFSERFFGMKDVFFVPGTADLKGNIMGGWVQYTYSIGSSLWMILLLNKWADYVNDDKYKKEYLLPMLKKAFNLLNVKFLIYKDGKYQVALSASPEYNDNRYSAWLKNSTYDVTLIKEFLRVFANRLKENGENAEEVEKILHDFASESIDGGYLISENLPLGESHRHMSHCMSIFPLQSIDCYNEQEKEIMAKTLERIEECGTARWVGYSFAWVAALYACFSDGDNALRYLNIFKNAFISSNGFHLNGDYKNIGYCDDSYRPFTLEGNGIFADALQEMLLQYHHEKLRLFPAIPCDWQEKGCSFERFYIHADIIVSASIKMGRVDCIIQNLGEERTLVLCALDKIQSVTLSKGKNSFVF